MQVREKTNLNTCTNEGKEYYKRAIEILNTITMEIYHKPLIVDVPSRQIFDPNTKVDLPDRSQRLW